MTYAWLADARRELKVGEGTNIDNDILLQRLVQVSDRIDLLTGEGPWFEPYVETHDVEITPQRVDSYRRLLYLDRPLLALAGVTISGAAPLSTISVYGRRTPYKVLRIDDCCYTWYSVACPDCPAAPPLVAEIAGVWGYRRRYGEAWWNADTVQNVGGINAAATAVTVADADGADRDGLTPRFSRGQLIAITTTGATEYMRVTAVNEATNALMIARGQNGTMAAAHNQNDVIQVFYPEESIRRVTARQATLLYQRRGAFERRAIDGFGVITSYPPDLLSELLGVLEEYQNEPR